MPTLIKLIGMRSILVKEDFDQVLEKLWPLQAPTSSLEARSNASYTQEESGDRLIILPQHVTAVIENGSPEEEEES